MIKRHNISEVRKLLPSLLDSLEESGDEVIITRRGHPIARLSRYDAESADPYPLRGLGVWVSPDFDEPLDDLWESLEDE